jgi:hypothetical protein
LLTKKTVFVLGAGASAPFGFLTGFGLSRKLRQLLSDAEQVYFLGFGFDSINVERLGIKSLDPGKALATAFELTTHEIGFLKEATNGKVSFYNNFDCIGLCRNVVNWR